MLKWRQNFPLDELSSGPLAVAEELRSRGYPAPASELAVQVGRDVVMVQELLPGKKIDHLDMPLLEQVLAEHGVVTGVVDWDGAGRGDHRFDLVTLRFGVHPAGADAEVVERLDALLDQLPEEVLRPSWAHMSLRMTDWAIRHFSHAEVEQWLEFAERRVG